MWLREAGCRKRWAADRDRRRGGIEVYCFVIRYIPRLRCRSAAQDRAAGDFPCSPSANLTASALLPPIVSRNRGVDPQVEGDLAELLGGSEAVSGAATEAMSQVRAPEKAGHHHAAQADES
jgi:hypothetical protein